MAELTLAGDRSRPPDSPTRQAVRSWFRKLTKDAESILSASPFGERLSEEEFAFCLLLIAAHL